MLWLQVKLKAVLSRSSDEAVGRGNAELEGCDSFAEAAKKMEQRRLDLAKVRAYARSLKDMLNALG